MRHGGTEDTERGGTGTNTVQGSPSPLVALTRSGRGVGG